MGRSASDLRARLCLGRGASSRLRARKENLGSVSVGADTLIHLFVKDIDAVSEEFGIPVDEEGLAGRECHLVDPDGNRLRVASRRS